MPEEHTSDGSLRATGLLAGLGASIPLVAAPMAGGPSTPALVLAAAEAGGLGFLAAGYKTPDQLAEQIAQVRSGTQRFGVNVFAPNPVPVERAAFDAYAGALRELAASYGVDLDGVEPREDDDEWDAKVELLASDPVPVVTFTFGLPPAGTVRRLQRAGSLVLQTVTSPNEAKQAAALGVDGLVVQSYLAGGHSGTLTPDAPLPEVPLVELLGRVHAEVDLPLWAAGGLSTAAGIHEALVADVQAVVLGTVLLRTPESGASAPYKAALAEAAGTGTSADTRLHRHRSYQGVLRPPARALRNRFVERFNDQAPAGYPALHHLTSPIRKAAAAAGDPEGINVWAGTGYRDATEEPAATSSAASPEPANARGRPRAWSIGQWGGRMDRPAAFGLRMPVRRPHADVVPRTGTPKPRASAATAAAPATGGGRESTGASSPARNVPAEAEEILRAATQMKTCPRAAGGGVFAARGQGGGHEEGVEGPGDGVGRDRDGEGRARGGGRQGQEPGPLPGPALSGAVPRAAGRPGRSRSRAGHPMP